VAKWMKASNIAWPGCCTGKGHVIVDGVEIQNSCSVPLYDLSSYH